MPTHTDYEILNDMEISDWQRVNKSTYSQLQNKTLKAILPAPVKYHLLLLQNKKLFIFHEQVTSLYNPTLFI